MAAIVADWTGGAVYTTNYTTSTGGTAEWANNVYPIYTYEGPPGFADPWPKPTKEELEEELKVITKELRRQQSLAACRWLDYLHNNEPLRAGQKRPHLCPRSTMRSTMTASRNWRRPCGSYSIPPRKRKRMKGRRV